MQISKGTVIFRHWNQQDGLNEIARTFKTLEELFGLCLQVDDKLLVDRVIVEGQDDSGAPRTVTLTFQSVTVHNPNS